MKISVFASGSKGNCTYIETEQTKIMIDAGISKAALLRDLEKNKIVIDTLDALLITHEHIDHTSGLLIFLKFFNPLLVITRKTYDALVKKFSKLKDYEKILFINNSDDYDLKDIHIKSIPIFHDAIDPIGFIINHFEKKLVYITDTGYIHKDELPLISDAEAYVFECNHDPEILMSSDRPYQTKIRILSNHGHLSNEDAMYALAVSVGAHTKKVFFAHISEECNLFEIIQNTCDLVFNDLGIDKSNIDFIYTSQQPTNLEEI